MRRILEDYEAKLQPPSGGGGSSGKAEWERYGDESGEFSARFRKLDLRDGADVEIRLDGVVLGEVSIRDGAGRIEFESRAGHEVPKVVTGRLIEVVHRGRVVLAGVFEPD